MYKILFDANPRTLSIRSAIHFATLLFERGCQVFYIDPSDSAITHDLITLGICVLTYPDDLQWFTPDLVLLDYHRKDRIPVYARYGIRHLFISTLRSMDEAPLQVKEHTPLLCLPPLPERRQAHGAREAEFIARIKKIRENPSRTIIISVLEDEHPHIYKVIKHCSIRHPQYHFILLIDRGNVSESLFALPSNVSIYRPSDMASLLPLCHLALVADRTNAQTECAFRHTPIMPFSESHPHIVPFSQFDTHLQDIIRRRAYLTDRQIALAGFFLHANRQLETWVDWTINYLRQKDSEKAIYAK